MSPTRTVAAVLALLTLAASAAAEEKQIQVAEGERLRVVDSGAGEPIVLVPGLLGSAFAFRKLVPPLLDRGHREIKLLAEGLHSFSVETVPNAGHFVFEEEPGAVIAAVGRAVASTREGSLVASAQARSR